MRILSFITTSCDKFLYLPQRISKNNTGNEGKALDRRGWKAGVPVVCSPCRPTRPTPRPSPSSKTTPAEPCHWGDFRCSVLPGVRLSPLPSCMRLSHAHFKMLVICSIQILALISFSGRLSYTGISGWPQNRKRGRLCAFSSKRKCEISQKAV